MPTSKQVLFVSILTVLAVCTAPGAQAQRVLPVMDVESAGVPAPLPAPVGGEVLYDQTGDPDDENFPSQTFEEAYGAFNSQGADDFVVPEGVTWNVAQVDVLGRYGEDQGPASVVGVYFYADDSGRPGDVIVAYSDVAVEDPDTTGTFAVELPSVLTLTEGVFWVSVVVDMDRVPDGQWYWNKQATAEPLSAEIHWRNPGDGFDTGCTDWSALVTECGDEGGHDASFRLLGTPSVANEDEGAPATFVVSRNYPNPFSHETAMEFGLPEAGHVTATVYDVLGRRVASLVDEVRPAGYHRVTWQAGGAPNGVYFCRVESSAGSRTLRMTVAR